jgi:hypothetical protein
MPASYSRTVKRRWGLGLEVGSPLAVYHVHYPFANEEDFSFGPPTSFEPKKRGTDLRLQIDSLTKNRFVAGTPQCVWWQADVPARRVTSVTGLDDGRDGEGSLASNEVILPNSNDAGDVAVSALNDYRYCCNVNFVQHC